MTFRITLLLVAVLAMIAGHAESSEIYDDASGKLRLRLTTESVVITRLETGEILAETERPKGAQALVGWDPLRPHCVLWMDNGGDGQFLFWSEQSGWRRETSEHQQRVGLRPIANSDGSPAWTFSKDGQRLGLILTDDGSSKRGTACCLHLHYGEANALFDGTKSTRWLNGHTLSVLTDELNWEVLCWTLDKVPSFQRQRSVATPVSPSGLYRLVREGGTMRLEATVDDSRIWIRTVPKNSRFTYRWHSAEDLLTAAEEDQGLSSVFIWSPTRHLQVPLGDQAGEGLMCAPWLSPDGARVAVLTAPVMGNFDFDAGRLLCCHTADGKIHELSAAGAVHTARWSGAKQLEVVTYGGLSNGHMARTNEVLKCGIPD